MSKIRRRIRRQRARPQPVRRSAAATAAREAARERTASGPELMIGGARDPAEARADARAAKALAGQDAGPAASRAACGACGPGEAARRSATGAAPGTANVTANVTAPGTASAPASKAANVALSELGSGRPLSGAERGFFEPRLGGDLGRVRLHEDIAADRAARAMDARAFTLGRDVGFARGERERGGAPLMAHELAHAVEEAPQVRRHVLYPAEHAGGGDSSFIEAVRRDYGLTDIYGLGGKGYATERKDSGELEGQIVQNLFWSDRVFKLAASDTDMALSELARHVEARWGIVDEAKSMHVGFTPDRAVFPHPAWRKFLKSAAALASQRHRELVEGLARGQATIDKAQVDWSLVFYDVLNEAMETGEHDALLDALSENNMFADEPSAEGAKYQYRLSCFMATLLLMFAGSRSSLRVDPARGESVSTLDDPLAFGISGMRALDRTSQTWLDWVPGDWGFIRNASPPSWIEPGAATEGENFVSIGDGMFWAHFSDDNTVGELESLMRLVRGWGLGAELTPLRIYPAAGLSP